MQFLYVNKNMTVSVFTNNIDHDHTWADETIWGISKKIKLVINDLYDSGVIKPQLIMYELRRRAVDEPTLKQLENYLRVYKCKKHGKTEISYYDLDVWCSKRTKIPEDLHEVFVIGDEIIIDEIDSSKSIFRVSVSTRFLLELGLKTRHLAADATYKLIFQGFPVFLFSLLASMICVEFFMLHH